MLFSLRNKREVSKSSQILFLSQIDDSFHHPPSTPSSSDKPVVHVQGLASHRIDVSAGESIPSKPTPSISPFPDSVIVPSNRPVNPPLPSEPSLSVPIPRLQSISSPRKQLTPSQKKQSIPSQKKQSTKHTVTLEELNYNQLIKRLQHKTLTVDLLLNTFSARLAPPSCLAIREMRFILLQNLVTTPASHSKRQYAQQVFDCLKKRFPSTTAQLSATATRPFQWRQPAAIAVAPSVETLLCAEFPSLFKACVNLSISFTVDSTRPRSLFEWQGWCVSQCSQIDAGESWFAEFPHLKKAMASPYRRNYWSKFNSALMTFRPSQPVAVHLPVSLLPFTHVQSLRQQDALIHSLGSTHATHLSAPLLTSEAVQSAAEWQEMVVETVPFPALFSRSPPFSPLCSSAPSRCSHSPLPSRPSPRCSFPGPCRL